MTNTETLDNLFLNQFEAYMCEHGFIYVKKYKMFMKCVNELLLQYIFPERLFQYVKGNVCFAIAGSIRSVYCESFDRKNLIKETIRNRNCIDLFGNNRECAKDDYEYNDENRIDVMEMAFEDAKKGIVSLFDKVNDINHYFDFCKNINPIQIFGATSFRGDSC